MARTVLYLQHASSLGGSCVSLLYSIQALNRVRIRPVIALAQPSSEVRAFYERAGVKTIDWPGIGVWNHTTAVLGAAQRAMSVVALGSTARNWKATEQRTLDLVERVKPDIVHLNSVVLSPSARALHRARVPFVWHVREHPPTSRGSARTALLRYMLREYADERIFLSEADRRAWQADGSVIYNFVDFRRFNRERDPLKERERFGVGIGGPVVLYVGGFSKLKGIEPLLVALAQLRKEFPGLKCLAPSTVHPLAKGVLKVARRFLPLVGGGTLVQRCEKRIGAAGLKEVVIRLPFIDDMPGLIAAADLVVFPALSPHFARPIIEAAAMAKPSVASDLDGMSELVENGKSGLLVKAGDANALVLAMRKVLADREFSRALGEWGYRLARERFCAERAGNETERIYRRLLGKEYDR